MPRSHAPLKIVTAKGQHFELDVEFVRGDSYYHARLYREGRQGLEAAFNATDRARDRAVSLVLIDLAYALFGEVPRERKGGGRDGHDRPGDGEPG